MTHHAFYATALYGKVFVFYFIYLFISELNTVQAI